MEDLLRGDKSFMGYQSFRTPANKFTQTKIFVEYATLILANQFYTIIREQRFQSGKWDNYMNVLAAIHKLEKTEMVLQLDKNYQLECAVTATQKEIRKTFGMTVVDIRKQAVGINDDLIRTGLREAQ